MGEDLKRVISVRGAYRGHCTRAIKAANEIMESYSPNLDTLEDVFEGLCSRMERLSLQNQKIELAVPEDKIEEEITQTLEYTDDLMGQKNKIAKFLRDAKAQVKQEQEEKKSFFSVLFMPYNKSFIDQASSVKMAGYWPRSLFTFLWTSTLSRSIKTQKENSAIIQPS